MPPAQQPGFMSMIPMVIVVAIFYFVVIRPENKKRKDHEALLKTLKKNDEVVTSGGMHGVVVNVKEGDTVVLRLDENCRIEFDRAAIARVTKKAE